MYTKELGIFNENFSTNQSMKELKLSGWKLDKTYLIGTPHLNNKKINGNNFATIAIYKSNKAENIYDIMSRIEDLTELIYVESFSYKKDDLSYIEVCVEQNANDDKNVCFIIPKEDSFCVVSGGVKSS